MAASQRLWLTATGPGGGEWLSNEHTPCRYGAMIRVLLSVMLAVAVIGAGAASAAHGLAHDAPQVGHEMQDMDADHPAGLANCCDVAGVKVGGSCFSDVVSSEMLVIDDGSFAGRITLPPYLRASAGVGPNVPTGPPKV